ncbi:MAG: hypothetical protein ABSF94_17400 [Steroidobacteraceae bacterium]|jgi:hypothetical protein
MFARPSIEQQLHAERVHYTVIRFLADNNDFNAIRYLYDRLNIIDAKAQGLLTRNSLLLTVVSILGAVKLRGDDHSKLFLSSALEQSAFAIGFLLLMVSTISTLYWMFFRFDHITAVPPRVLERMKGDCACVKAGTLVEGGSIPTDCKHTKQCGLALLAQNAVGQSRTLEQYENEFFEITISRQNKLRFAQFATYLASIIFFVLIGYIFWAAMDQLYFH